MSAHLKGFVTVIIF